MPPLRARTYVRRISAELIFCGANLSFANLSFANLSGANLFDANLSLANLTRAKLITALLNGAFLREADVSGAALTGAKLSRAHLGGAKLIRTDFSWAHLSEANLSDADLSRADLRFADLSRASLRTASLSGAHLDYAIFRGTILTGLDLSRAHLKFTVFADLDLSDVKGLETIEHDGPSNVDIGTIYQSHGKIPKAFLRGCGVPVPFIEYMSSLVGSPIEFYSCFISYSTRDQEFADRLHADLQAQGIRCWFAPHHIKAGLKIRDQLDEAIRMHDKLLLILSEDSMKSAWVKTEVANARRREEFEKKQMLFPITLVPYESVKKWELFDADRGIDSASEIRAYFIPDFSNWEKQDSYQSAFERLVRDLKSAARG